MSALDNIKNFFFSKDTGPVISGQAGVEDPNKNLTARIFRQQLAVLKQDTVSWRNVLAQATVPYFPQRLPMQQLFEDTVKNGHVFACMARRERLSLQRNHSFYINDKKDDNITAIFQAPWFEKFLAYAISAEAYGYTLVALGDILINEFKDLNIIRRWNVSPDRMNVADYQLAITGTSFIEGPASAWHVWIPTKSVNGESNCGYGYLYPVALYEIFLRNIMGFNGDFVEMFSQPYRHGKTMKSDGPEREQFENALLGMGSAGYIITDMQDEVAFLESSLGGTGWQGYDNFEARCEKKISKIILGHADAMDSTPGKLGGTQGGEDSPIDDAFSELQSQDGKMLQNVVNNILIPKMRDLGVTIPEGVWRFDNDDEIQENKRREDESNVVTATIALTMKNAGLQMDAAYFTERTGIPAEAIAPPAPVVAPIATTEKPPVKALPKKAKNMLTKLYS